LDLGLKTFFESEKRRKTKIVGKKIRQPDKYSSEAKITGDRMEEVPSNVVSLDEARLQKKRKVEPYNFVEEFELAVVYLLCHKKAFFAQVGHLLEADLMSTPNGKLGVKVAQMHAAERKGVGPGRTYSAMQRARELVSDGKLMEQEFENFCDMLIKFDILDTKRRPQIDETLVELIPILKRRGRRDAIMRGLDCISKGKTLADVSKQISDIEGLSTTHLSCSFETRNLDSHALEAIRELKYAMRLSTGIRDLDVALGGGLPLRTMGMVIGGAGEGKSIFLEHVGSQAIRRGLNVATATLELDSAFVMARYFSNLAGVLESNIQASDPTTHCEVLQRLEAQRLQGILHVEYFDPGATTVPRLREWVENCEETSGRKIDLVIVDYADLMTPVSKSPVSRYEAQGLVYQALSNWAKEADIWIWTASQAQRKHKLSKHELRTIDEAADSQEKARIADLAVTLNCKTDEFSGFKECTYNIVKFRMGRSGVSVGPIPTEFEYGRMCPNEW
jgi:KaiC/GvpD/RAD55 family RecA-like ATPase